MKQLNNKFKIFLFLFVIVLAFLMIILQILSIKKTTNSFYSEYGENALNLKKNLIQYSNNKLLSVSNIFLDIDLENNEKINDVAKNYINSGIFGSLYIFDNKNTTIYISDKLYGENYENILMNIYDSHLEFDNQNLTYSQKINSFILANQKLDENQEIIANFIFINNVDNFAKRTVNKYDNLYVFNIDNTVFYPAKYEENIDFNNCSEDLNSNYDGILKYDNYIFDQKCVAWTISSKEMNKTIEIIKEVLIIIITALLEFFLFIVLFYFSRRNLK